MSFTVDQQATIHNYFIMYDVDGSGGLSKTEFPEVLRAMDRLPRKGSVDEAVMDHLMGDHDQDGDGELDFAEFVSLLQMYYSAVYKRAFLDNSHKSSESGETMISKKNLRLALHELQEAGFALLYKDLEQIISKGDDILCEEKNVEHQKEEHTLGFTFEMFHQVLEYFREFEFVQLRQSAGFDPERIAFMKRLFQAADTDGSGALDIKEIAEQFVKAAIPIPDVDQFIGLFARMDVDKSASLSFQEILRFMSIYSKTTSSVGDDIATMTGIKSLNKNRTSNFSEIAKQTLMEADEVFRHFQNAHDMVNNALIQEVEEGTLAVQWGLSVADMRALRESFEFCDVDGSGSIDQNELVALLTNLGFPPNTAFQKAIFNECLEPDSSALIFIRCIQWVLNYFTCLAKRAFQAHVQGDRIPRKMLLMVLYQVGQYVGKNTVDDWLHENGLPEDAGLDAQMFGNLIVFLRSKSLEKWRRTYGFPDHKVERFKTFFSIAQSKAQAGEECIDLSRVEAVLERLGYMDDPLNQGVTLLNALTRVDREATGMLTFQDFLLLLRHLDNSRARKQRAQEELAIRMSGLDPDTVSLLRQAFNSCSENDTGAVTQHDIKLLLSKYQIITTQEQRKKLNVVLEEVHEDCGDVVTFATFLRILRSIDHNVA